MWLDSVWVWIGRQTPESLSLIDIIGRRLGPACAGPQVDSAEKDISTLLHASPACMRTQIHTSSSIHVTSNGALSSIYVTSNGRIILNICDLSRHNILNTYIRLCQLENEVFCVARSKQVCIEWVEATALFPVVPMDNE
jgi:hypothetical protein